MGFRMVLMHRIVIITVCLSNSRPFNYCVLHIEVIQHGGENHADGASAYNEHVSFMGDLRCREKSIPVKLICSYKRLKHFAVNKLL